MKNPPLFRKMCELFKKEIEGVSLYNLDGDYRLVFESSGNILAYDKFNVISGYGNVERDTAYRYFLSPLGFHDELEAAYSDVWFFDDEIFDFTTYDENGDPI